MVPYHGGAFLPTEQRYTSITYRRIRKALWWPAGRMSKGDAVELMCVYLMLEENMRALRAIFHIHDEKRVRQLERLMNHAPLRALAEPAHQANLAAMDVETGLGALRALLDGGWKYGKPPEFMRRALQSLRREGKSVEKIAAMFGIKYERMRDWLVPRKPRGRKRAEASAMLAIG